MIAQVYNENAFFIILAVLNVISYAKFENDNKNGSSSTIYVQKRHYLFILPDSHSDNADDDYFLYTIDNDVRNHSIKLNNH